jgi:hypothetical protein
MVWNTTESDHIRENATQKFLILLHYVSYTKIE